jgi:glucose-6-phosphate dehydrogenase assembly protein OpcA
MAQATQLHASHASGLSAVERELQALHRARLRFGDEEHGVRLSVLTLVVACTDAAGADAAADVVMEISAEHPARALLLIAHRGAPSGIEADLSLQCSAARGSEQVCAEIVRLTVGGEAALHLSSVVAPLLVPDVPVQLWLHGAPDLTQALAPETLAMCERVILDTAAYPDAAKVLPALAAIAPGPHGEIPVSDLTWARLTTWREVLARELDGSSRRAFLEGVERIAVRTGAAGGNGADALLFAGWLADRLGVDVALDRPAGVAPGLGEVMVDARSLESRLRVDINRDADGLTTKVLLDGAVAGSRHVSDEPPRLAELVGAALQQQGHDPVYAAALRSAVALVR